MKTSFQSHRPTALFWFFAMFLDFGGASARAASYANDFNVDPATDPNFSLRGNAVWRPTGSYNGSGYISLTDAVGSQQGTIVLPDLDGGVPTIGFNVKMKLRIGGGTARPADGFSVSFANAADAVVGSGTVGEEGTATGLSVNIDTWDNGNGDGPALDIKVDGVIVAHKRFVGSGPQTSTPGPWCAPVEKDGAGDPISLSTDSAGTPAPGTWVDLEINQSSCGTVSVKYKGMDIFKDVVTGYAVNLVRAGRFVIAARTGAATDNHWIDDLIITTDTGDTPPRMSSASPAGNPGRDVSENSIVQFVIDYSASFFEPDLGSIRLNMDGTDVTGNPDTTINNDPLARTTTVNYNRRTPFAPASRHEAVLNFRDVGTVPCTALKVFYVTPVPAGTVAGTTLFIEAEDFNYMDTADNSAGHFFNFGSPNGSYDGKAAKHDTDYHLATSNPDSPLYRVLNPPNGISVPGVPDDLRAGVAITPDYKVGRNDAGDWYNFTRTFPNTTYKIYGRFASGGADTHVNLSKVTSDPTAGNQASVSLGTFDGDATGGWDTFCFIPLRDLGGQEVVVPLKGLTTLRVTTLPGNYDANYFAFVPTPLSPNPPPPNGPGYALNFDGMDDYVSVPHNASLNAYPLTISAWVKTSRNTSLADGIISKYIDASANGYSLFLYNGRVRGSYFRNSANYVWDGSLGLDGGVIADGAWHHVAFLVDAAGGRLLVDGVVSATLPWTGTPGPATSTAGFQIGRYWTYNNAFLGQIDEVRLWNMALTTAQIQAEMRRQLFGNELGLVAYYRLDENAGLSAFDSTGHMNNTATLVNGPTWLESTIVPFAPPVTTLVASDVSGSSATLNGMVDGRTSTTAFEAYFEWGDSVSLGNERRAGLIVNPGAAPRNFSIPLTGLVPGSTYYFRAVAVSNNGPSYGAIFTVEPLAVVITDIRVNGPETEVSFITFPGLLYHLESKDALVPGPWTFVSGSARTGNDTGLTVLDSRPQAPQRFYRAVMTP